MSYYKDGIDDEAGSFDTPYVTISPVGDDLSNYKDAFGQVFADNHDFGTQEAAVNMAIILMSLGEDKDAVFDVIEDCNGWSSHNVMSRITMQDWKVTVEHWPSSKSNTPQHNQILSIAERAGVGVTKNT